MVERLITKLSDVPGYLGDLPVRILGKGGLNNLQSSDFASDFVPGYELHLTEKDLALPIDAYATQKGRIVGAHHVTFHTWEGRPRQSSLADEGAFGDLCEVGIEGTVDLLAALGGEYVVIHPATVDPAIVCDTREPIDVQLAAYAAAKMEAVEKAAVRINRLISYAKEKGVVIALETDAAWVWRVFEQGVVDTPEHMHAFMSLCPEAFVIIDEEHVYRSAVFNAYLPDYVRLRKQFYGDEEAAGVAWLEMIHRKFSQDPTAWPTIRQFQIYPYMTNMIAGFGNRALGIHSCGWDIRRDGQNVVNSPAGTSYRDAHLPIRRVIDHLDNEDLRLIDTIDHAHTLATVLAYGAFTEELQPWVVLEYGRHLNKKRNFMFGSRETKQTSAEEFALCAMSWTHLIRSQIGTSSSLASS